MAPKLVMASDHGGFELKEHLKRFLAAQGDKILDLGVHSLESVDYPDLAHSLANALLAGNATMGILLCGTGIGVSIAANRHAGIRAALCTDPFMAKMSREHNDANVLCLGGRILGPALAEEIVTAFLTSAFQGGRHLGRLAKIDLP
jgi:ribose 5-phosphate isomerase B